MVLTCEFDVSELFFWVNYQCNNNQRWIAAIHIYVVAVAVAVAAHLCILWIEPTIGMVFTNRSLFFLSVYRYPTSQPIGWIIGSWYQSSYYNWNINIKSISNQMETNHIIYSRSPPSNTIYWSYILNHKPKHYSSKPRRYRIHIKLRSYGQRLQQLAHISCDLRANTHNNHPNNSRP